MEIKGRAEEEKEKKKEMKRKIEAGRKTKEINLLPSIPASIPARALCALHMLCCSNTACYSLLSYKHRRAWAELLATPSVPNYKSF